MAGRGADGQDGCELIDDCIFYAIKTHGYLTGRAVEKDRILTN
jgi:hypothetical protein